MARLNIHTIIMMVVFIFTSGCAEVVFHAKPTREVKAPKQGTDDSTPSKSFVAKTSALAIDSKIDILFVVDNSASMLPFQNNMKSRIQGLMSRISHLDYQIAVTTTDPVAETLDPNGDVVSWGDGLFRSFDSSTPDWQILSPDSTENLSHAEAVLGTALQVGAHGNGNERGIHATYRAIERRRTSPAQHDFFRAGTALAVVLISDEDECNAGGCVATSPTSQPGTLLELVDSEFGGNKIFTFHSIVHPASGCADAHELAAEGRVYKQLSQATGGVIGNVCNDDYSGQLSAIGSETESLARTARLECEPQDTSDDGMPDISVFDGAGVQLQVSYKVSGDRVRFDQALPNGDYSVQYFCKN